MNSLQPWPLYYRSPSGILLVFSLIACPTILAATSASRAATLVADFDSFPESSQGPILQDGGITFSENINNVGAFGNFAIDHFYTVVLPFAELSRPAFLSTAGFGVGTSQGLGSVRSFVIDFPGVASSMSVDVVGRSIANGGTPKMLTLDGLRDGQVIGSASVVLDTTTNRYSIHRLVISGFAFDKARIYSNWQQQPTGTIVPAAFDNFRVNLIPEPSPVFMCIEFGCILLSTGAMPTRARNLLRHS